MFFVFSQKVHHCSRVSHETTTSFFRRSENINNERIWWKALCWWGLGPPPRDPSKSGADYASKSVGDTPQKCVKITISSNQPFGKTTATF